MSGGPLGRIGGRWPALGLAALAFGLTLFAPEPPKDEDDDWGPAAEARSCPKGMVSIGDDFCIDQFEAAVVEVDGPRTAKHKPRVLRAHSPFKPVTGIDVMAVSQRGKLPQGYISRDEAEQACVNAGKRLCSDEEWLKACRGKSPTKYPYGDEHEEGACNDAGVSGFNLLYGPGNNQPPEASVYTRENMNDPRLNQIEGSLAKTGAFKKCRNAYKVHDMVGNLHEWTAAKEGTFRGGYYLDTKINGEGCDYRTTAHDARYHDYSTGFRCCFGGPEQQKIEKALKAAAVAKKKKDGDATTDAKGDGKTLAKKTKKKKKKKDGAG